MKEIPVIFNTEMVKAIMEGRKTQTRRPLKLQPPDNTYKFQAIQGFNGLAACFISSDITKQAHWVKLHGKVGDRLYVRETWVEWKGINCPCGYNCNCEKILYKADSDTDFANECERPDEKLRWKPSIHMHKEHARIWLDITAVRVERLQDISEEDAREEGMDRLFEKYGTFYATDNITRKSITLPHEWVESYGSWATGFKQIWNSIYNNWNDNPWVYVREFKKVTV